MLIPGSPRTRGGIKHQYVARSFQEVQALCPQSHPLQEVGHVVAVSSLPAPQADELYESHCVGLQILGMNKPVITVVLQLKHL